MHEVFWIRLFCSEFDDPRWLAIEHLPDADAVQLIYVRMLMLAGRCNASGLLLLHESLPYDATTLAAVLRRTVPVIQFALSTLERFKFIELLDNVIAITAWDRLQPTDELTRLAERREKDKLRKRMEREDRRNKLLISSEDTSVDSPGMSKTTKIKPDSITTTTRTSQKGKDIVAGVGDLEEVITLIPQTERNKRLLAVIADSVSRLGKIVTTSNIRYALANHNPSKGTLGGMICAAIEHDFAQAGRESARVKEEAQAAALAMQESSDLLRREQEERERQEALAQQASWLLLPVHERVRLALQAQKRFPCLPTPMAPLETAINDPAVPITKILAAMYARGELPLVSEGG